MMCIGSIIVVSWSNVSLLVESSTACAFAGSRCSHSDFSRSSGIPYFLLGPPHPPEETRWALVAEFRLVEERFSSLSWNTGRIRATPHIPFVGGFVNSSLRTSDDNVRVEGLQRMIVFCFILCNSVGLNCASIWMNHIAGFSLLNFGMWDVLRIPFCSAEFLWTWSVACVVKTTGEIFPFFFIIISRVIF